MGRGDTREDVRRGDRFCQLVVGQSVDLRTGRDRSAVEQVELGGDALGGARVIAGDHHDVDPGVTEVADRFGCGVAGGITEADEAGEGQPADAVVGEIVMVLCFAFCQRQHAQASPRQIAGHAGKAGPVIFGERHVAGGTRPTVAAWQQHLGCALHADAEPVAVVAEDGVETTRRLERHLREAPPVLPTVSHGDRRHLCAAQDRAVGGVREPSVARIGCRPQRDRENPPQSRRDGADWRFGLTVGDDLGLDMTDGQRPGLVGADDVHPAEGLDRARVPHQRTAARKAAGGAELRDGRQQRQPFGHGGDREAHARADRLPHRASPQHADRDDGGAGPQRHRNGERGERTQTGFDAAGGRRPTEQHAAAGLGRVADRDDHACGLAGGDRRALVDHGRPLRDEGRVGR